MARQPSNSGLISPDKAGHRFAGPSPPESPFRRCARANRHRWDLLSVELANYFSINRLGPVACPRPREVTKIVSKRMNLSNGSRD
jgi:hypothetical protein